MEAVTLPTSILQGEAITENNAYVTTCIMLENVVTMLSDFQKRFFTYFS